MPGANSHRLYFNKDAFAVEGPEYGKPEERVACRVGKGGVLRGSPAEEVLGDKEAQVAGAAVRLRDVDQILNLQKKDVQEVGCDGVNSKHLKGF